MKFGTARDDQGGVRRYRAWHLRDGCESVAPHHAQGTISRHVIMSDIKEFCARYELRRTCNVGPTIDRENHARSARLGPSSRFDAFRVIHSPRLQHFEQKAELIGSQMDAKAAGFVIKL
jgi:hypothetical protein